ncbi:porin [Blattabacterium cuenoti]|uniref:porin n=1 Tax=Blattabacterium cuenoti TaxID=1653831 RepID=UPI001EECD280|nr:porin [Blattabacterium cuenoti]
MYIDFTSSVNSRIEKNPFEKDVLERNIFDGVFFSTDELKLETIGKANEKISYHFSQRFFLKKKMDPEKEKKLEYNNNKIDNPTDTTTPTMNIHLAYLKYRCNEKLSFLIGKLPVTFVSIFSEKNKENPVGMNFIYTPIKNHEFLFQILNSIKNKNQYEHEQPIINLRPVRYPMGYSLNWNWSAHKIQNRWAYSIFQENHKEKFWKLLSLGSKLDFSPFSIEMDYVFSDEDIERNGDLTTIFHSLISRNTHRNPIKKVSPVTYATYLLKLHYNFPPRWNFFTQGVYEMGRSKEGIDGTHWILKDQLFKRAYAYSVGIEYKHPIIINHNHEIRLYLVYTRGKVLYLDTNKILQKENKNDHSISLGLNYRIQLF